nr:hypothetical protein [Tanacetum cinerariifolium]
LYYAGQRSRLGSQESSRVEQYRHGIGTHVGRDEVGLAVAAHISGYYLVRHATAIA